MSRTGNYIGISTATDYTKKLPFGNKGVWSLKSQFNSKIKKEWVSLTPRTDTLAQYLQLAMPFNYYTGITDMAWYIKEYNNISGGTPSNLDIQSSWGEFISLENNDTNPQTFLSAFPVNYGSSGGVPIITPADYTPFRYSSIYAPTPTVIGLNPYCIEMWIYVENFAFATTYSFEMIYPSYKDTNDTTQFVPNWTIKGDYWPGAYPRGLWFGYPQYPYNQVFIFETSSYLLQPNTWHHVAVTRDSSYNTRMFIDGVYHAVAYDATNYLGSVYTLFPTSKAFNGQARFQDLRVYVGVPKYTGSFTPPGSMFLQD